MDNSGRELATRGHTHGSEFDPRAAVGPQDLATNVLIYFFRTWIWRENDDAGSGDAGSEPAWLVARLLGLGW